MWHSPALVVRFAAILLLLGSTGYGCIQCRCPARPAAPGPASLDPSSGEKVRLSAPKPAPALQAFVDEVLKPRSGSKLSAHSPTVEVRSDAGLLASKPEPAVAKARSRSEPPRHFEPDSATPASTISSTGKVGARAVPNHADTNLFTIDLYPTRVYLATGQDKTARITLTRAAGFDGNVRIAVSGIPKSVSANASFTILAGQERRFLTLEAGADAAFTTTELAITGTATLEDEIHTKTTILPVTITRQRGPFREVVPAFPGSGHDDESPDNGMVVTIEPEPAEGPYRKYSASFRTVDGNPLGGPIRFFTEPGSRLGGVSFCDKSKAGVILSVNARSLGFDADAMLAVLDLRRPKAFRAYEVHTGTAGGRPVRPRVFVSPDCTLVAFMEAAVSGSSRTTLTLVDVTGGSTLVEDMPFHGTHFAGKVLIWKERLYVEIRDGEHIERVQVPLSGRS